MAQSLAQVAIHIVFSTNGRLPLLSDSSTRLKLHAYITGICKRQGSPCLQIGGTADHIHILCALSRSVTIADLVREIKRSSTNWVKNNIPDLPAFAWQAGYGVFAISVTHVSRLKQYIQAQEEHHKKISFQDELRRILKENAISYDERYLWD